MTIAVKELVEPPAAASDASRDNAKLRQILEGARRVFLTDGFDAASMNDIARAAGVSKGTLYVYFDSKEALFEALIRSEKAQQAEQICRFDADASDTVPQVLTRMGGNLMRLMTSPEKIAQVRTVIAASAKFPQIGRAFNESGAQHGVARLASYLDGQVAAGVLSIRDTRVAANHFIQMCQAEFFRHLLFRVVDSVAADEIDAAVAEAVSIFMTVYEKRA